MNLLFQKILGVLTSTSKFEKMQADLISNMNRYFEIGSSPILAEYQSLRAIINTNDFQKNKKLLQTWKYKDTKEYVTIRKYDKLHNSAKLALYKKVLNSVDLKNFLAFKESADYCNIGNKKMLKSDDNLRRMKAYEKSKEYKIYLKYRQSNILSEYQNLKSEIETPEFIKNNTFWANPKRWETTPEFIQEKRFKELSKDQDILFYTTLDISYFKIIQDRTLSFDEQFRWKTLDDSSWEAGFYHAHGSLSSKHSYINEKQAYNNGKNVFTQGGKLLVVTKHETITSKAWHERKGFVMNDFSYTSDALQTGKSFQQEFGTFEAKIRCTGKINHAFYLTTERGTPVIKLFHFDGKAINVGNSSKDGFDQKKITGISVSDFYIYKLVWTSKELIWKINNLEVYRTSNNVPRQPMFMEIKSFIPLKQHGNEGSLEFEWIKVFC